MTVLYGGRERYWSPWRAIGYGLVGAVIVWGTLLGLALAVFELLRWAWP